MVAEKVCWYTRYNFVIMSLVFYLLMNLIIGFYLFGFKKLFFNERSIFLKMNYLCGLFVSLLSCGIGDGQHRLDL